MLQHSNFTRVIRAPSAAPGHLPAGRLVAPNPALREKAKLNEGWPPACRAAAMRRWPLVTRFLWHLFQHDGESIRMRTLGVVVGLHNDRRPVPGLGTLVKRIKIVLLVWCACVHSEDV